MKRKKPVQDHTSEHKDVHLQTVSFRPIGVVHSPYTERFGTPRQPPITEQVLGDQTQAGVIELHRGHNFEQALRDLDGFERIWVLFVFHLNSGWNPMVRPPRGPGGKQGLFATRAPHRPNPIGLSCLQLDRIDGRKVYVRGIDILDQTPVLDIKPYVPYADAFPDARAGWLTGLRQHEADHYDP